MTLLDDVLATRKPGPNVLVHRPIQEHSVIPACAAAATERYQRFPAALAQLINVCVCRNCWPAGWAVPQWMDEVPDAVDLIRLVEPAPRQDPALTREHR